MPSSEALHASLFYVTIHQYGHALKASMKHRVDRLSPEEERDIQQSLKEIREGKARMAASSRNFLKTSILNELKHHFDASGHLYSYVQ